MMIIFSWHLTNRNLAGAAGADRQIVLFKLVNALADQLRGVFAPYYKSLADLMVGHLGGSKHSGKRKRSVTKALPEYDGPDAPFLRYQARSLKDSEQHSHTNEANVNSFTLPCRCIPIFSGSNRLAQLLRHVDIVRNLARKTTK